jgi:hypothetical protein
MTRPLTLVKVFLPGEQEFIYVTDVWHLPK